MQREEYSFKFILIGDMGSGKTSMLRKFLGHKFDANISHTEGAETSTQMREIDGRLVKLQICDIAGQERFRAASRTHFKGAIGVVLVFDITRRITFKHLNNWLSDARSLTCPRAITLLVGNKADLEMQREIESEEALQFANENGLTYIEWSAMSDSLTPSLASVSVSEDPFTRLSSLVCSAIDAGEIDPHQPDSGVEILSRPKSTCVPSQPSTQSSTPPPVGSPPTATQQKEPVLKSLRNLLTCSLCEHHISDPTFLPFRPCLHSFCRSCVQGLTSTLKQVACPECGATCTPPPPSSKPSSRAPSPLSSPRDIPPRPCSPPVVILQPHFEPDEFKITLLGVLENFESEEKVQKERGKKGSGEDVVTSELCWEDENASVAFCETCKKHLCQLHLDAHRMSRLTKDHSTKLLHSSSPQKPSQLSVSSHAVLMCKDHPGQELVGYCVTDHCLICRDCSGFGKHRMHDVGLVSEFAKRASAEITATSHRAAAFIDALSSQKRAIESALDELSKSKNEQIKKVETEMGKLMTAVEERKQALIREIELTSEAKKASMDSLLIEIDLATKSACAANTFAQVLNRVPPHAILNLREQTIQHVSDAEGVLHSDPIKHAPCARLTAKIDCGEVESTIRGLGKISISRVVPGKSIFVDQLPSEFKQGQNVTFRIGTRDDQGKPACREDDSVFLQLFSGSKLDTPFLEQKLALVDKSGGVWEGKIDIGRQSGKFAAQIVVNGVLTLVHKFFVLEPPVTPAAPITSGSRTRSDLFSFVESLRHRSSSSATAGQSQPNVSTEPKK